MKTEKKSFILYKDTLEIHKKLTDKQLGQLFRAIIFYQNGQTFEIPLELELVFELFKNQFVRDDEKSKRGQYHWNWRGGITPENRKLRNSTRYKHWRRTIFERDLFTCQTCKQVGGTLHAHHIERWSVNKSLRFEEGNGITLCKKCHINQHKNER